MKRVIIVFLTLMVILLIIPIEAYSANSYKSLEIDTTELTRFVDEFFGENMDEFHIPGAAIAFVRGDEVIFKKGYGYADIENNIPVNPDKTLFDIASVSKLFTTTAVLQQAERGKIDLNRDVNSYLNKFQIDNSFDTPITVKDLIRHTTGFNNMNIDQGTKDKNKIKSLEQYLSTSIPRRIYRPGEFFTYSNQGMSLAGYIVELVSGVPFSQNIEQNIFRPLAMDSSNFSQVLPVELENRKALGYRYSSKNVKYIRAGITYYYAQPAAACSTTINDMTRFIIANLNEGRYEGRQILKKETMEEMHKQQFSHNTDMPGQAYGFWESYENNQRGLFHTGTTDGFANMLYILPEKKIGFILCYNRAAERFRSEFLTSFLDRFYPTDINEGMKPLVGSEERVKPLEGLYWSVEKARFTMDKLEVLFSDGLIRAIAVGGGKLRLSGFWGEKLGEYIEIRPMVFKSVSRDDIITFRGKGNGINEENLFIKNDAFRKAAWYESPTLYLFFMGISLLFLLVAFFTWILKFIFRIVKKVPHTAVIQLAAEAFGLFVISVCLISAAVSGAAIGSLGKYAFLFGVPFVIKLMLALSLLVDCCTIGLIIFSILAWWKKYWTMAWRVQYTLVTISIIGYVAFMNFWNLIGFNYR